MLVEIRKMHAHVYYLNWDEDDGDEASHLQEQVRDGEYPDADVVESEKYRYVGMWDGVDEISDVWDLLERNPEGYDRRLDELEERSIYVGDIVVLGSSNGGEAHLVLPIGWEQIGGYMVQKRPIDHDRELGVA